MKQKIKNKIPEKQPLLLDIGFGNSIVKKRIVAIIAYDSDPVIRHCKDVEKEAKIIDATKGRKTKTAIFLENGQIVLSAQNRETINDKF